ncbi:MAG: hypothetical protein MUO26_10335 [Methanotrichaceae archaeon]|nr:hypothetical protein [Methanotrichaceae archaeon]
MIRRCADTNFGMIFRVAVISIPIFFAIVIAVSGQLEEGVNRSQKEICGHITASQHNSHNVTIDEGMAFASFIMNWTESADLGLYLIEPNGFKLDRTTMSPSVFHDRFEPVEIFSITNPEAGEWVIEIEPSEVPKEGANYCILVDIVGNQTIAEQEVGKGRAKLNGLNSDRGIDLDNDKLFDCITIRVGANVYSADVYILSGQLFDSNGKNVMNITSKPLFGIGAKFFELDFCGLKNSTRPYYLKNIELKDFNGNVVDLSNETYTTHVYNNLDPSLAPTAKLMSSIKDNLTDADKDGVYDFISIDVGVDVESPGVFNLRGELVDSKNNTQLAWAVDQQNLSVGLQTMHLDFDTKKIQDKKAKGPFCIRNLFLSWGSSETYWVPLDSINKICNISAYDFGADPISSNSSEKIISGHGNGELLLTFTIKKILPVFSARYSYDIVGINIPPIVSPWNYTGSKAGYSYSMEGVYMPNKPNDFSVAATGVRNLNIGLRQNEKFKTKTPQRVWVTSSVLADKKGVAIAKSDLISPGNYDIKILGEAAENTSEINLVMTLVKKIIVKDRFNFSIDTSGFPSGNLTMNAKALNGSISLDELSIENL